MRKPEIFLRPFREARIESRVMRGAGGAQPGVKGLGVLIVRDGRIEIGPAAEPSLRGCQEAGVHVNGRDMRVGVWGDQSDAGGEEPRVRIRAGNGAGELLAEAPADGGDVDPHLLEHLARHLTTDSAAAGRAVVIGALPVDELEGSVAPGLALDRFEGGADAVAKRFEPVAGGLLLVVEGKHEAVIARSRSKVQGEARGDRPCSLRFWFRYRLRSCSFRSSSSSPRSPSEHCPMVKRPFS